MRVVRSINNISDLKIGGLYCIKIQYLDYEVFYLIERTPPKQNTPNNILVARSIRCISKEKVLAYLTSKTFSSTLVDQPAEGFVDLNSNRNPKTIYRIPRSIRAQYFDLLTKELNANA